MQQDATLPVALPALFEASGDVPPWAAARIRQLGANLKNYKEFATRQCIATGVVTFQEGLVSAVELEIAADRDLTLSELVTAVDSGRLNANLSSALRLFVFDHYRTMIGAAAAQGSEVQRAAHSPSAQHKRG